MPIRVQNRPVSFSRPQTPAPGFTVKRAAIAVGAMLAGLPRAAATPLCNGLEAPVAPGAQLQPRADVTKPRTITDTMTVTVTKQHTVTETSTTTATKTKTSTETLTNFVTRTKVGGTVTVPAATVTTGTATVTVTMAGSTVTLPGSTVTLPASTVTVPASTVTVPASTVTVPASTVTVPASTVTVPGSAVTASASTVTLPASTVTLSGSPVTSTVTVTASQPADPTPDIQYYGGPVIGAPTLFTLFWNSKVNYQIQLGEFYNTLVSSDFMSLLAEYSTPSTKIGAGSIAGSFVDNQPTTGTVTDQQIVAEIAAKIDSQVIAVTSNTLVAVHFPAGISITVGGQQSCIDFCSYAGAFVHNGNNMYYTVVADMTPICCRKAEITDNIELLTSVSSEAFIDAVTNPALFLVQGDNFGVPPTAWLDNTNQQFVTGGQCEDIIETLHTPYGADGRQGFWSNSQKACI